MGFFSQKKRTVSWCVITWISPGVFQKGKVVPSHTSVHPLWQKILWHKGLVLLKNESSSLNELRPNCFFLKAIPSSPNSQTRLFFKVTWKALKVQDSGRAISVKCRGDVSLLDVVVCYYCNVRTLACWDCQWGARNTT